MNAQNVAVTGHIVGIGQYCSDGVLWAYWSKPAAGEVRDGAQGRLSASGTGGGLLPTKMQLVAIDAATEHMPYSRVSGCVGGCDVRVG